METDAGAATAGSSRAPHRLIANPRRLAAPWVERLRPELLPALGAAALAGVISIWVMQLWRVDLKVPIVVGGDPTAALASIKDILTHGWYLTNPSLGVPFGQEFYDYPAYSGDTLYLLMAKALGLVSSDPVVVMNVFFLLCFPLITISAYLVLRRLGISLGAAFVCSVLYTVQPFRFDNSEGHIFLAAYFLVPVGCYLVLTQFMGRALFKPNPQRRGLRAYLTWRSAALVVLCLMVGSSDNYFAVFTVALMIPATIFSFIAVRRRQALIGGLVTVLLVLGTVGLNGLPTFIYAAQHGKNTVPGHRVPQETEMYGLSLANLVLPIEGHRIKPLANLTNRYLTTTLLPVRGETSWNNLGIVATLGLLWLVIALVVRCLRGGESGISDPRYAYAAIAAAIAFLIGTIGGLQTVFAYVVSPRLHAPNRIAIFVAFFALFGVALGLDQLRRRFAAGAFTRWVSAAMLVLVLAVGTFDQTSPKMIPPYAKQAAQYHSDATFIRAIERQLPGDASVFEFPYVPFPEAQPPGRMLPYDEFIGYLHSDRLRWSDGAMEGRPSDWVSVAITHPLPQLLQEISAIGFQGVYLDTFGFSDNGKVAIAALKKALGSAPLVSPNGRLYFFNMAQYNQQLHQRISQNQLAALAAAALYPG
ncbi:MAG TPA: hypothetical protein VLJ42_12070 [Solirubrobacteraceae bacterium]|nr:hypothetical protein [Solirubrobacteraceae bacterium]